MRSRLSLAGIRRCGLAKLFATILVVLAVSPLTAPFSTFDAADMLGETLVHSDGGAGKLVQDAIDLTNIVAHLPPSWTEVSDQPMRRIGTPTIQAAGPLVLRI